MITTTASPHNTTCLRTNDSDDWAQYVTGTSPARGSAARRTGPICTVTTNQFKNGNHIDVDGVVFKIIEFQHVKPGKGGAFVRTKLRRASDGAVIDRTFRAGEKFRAVRTEARKMQFLYSERRRGAFHGPLLL